jgi:predicted unusual protein kinase regulating ubiquinone biosynthesis (AarF/ABC1/UbiB family)
MADDHQAGVRRAFSIANMGVGIAGSYLGYAVQRAILGETKTRGKLSATHTRAARRMADEMQTLRGAAMKFGQTLSLQTGTLPDETLAELATLQMNAPPMHPSLVRAQFKQSLGTELEETFKQFTAEPFAAASLGQVHQAVTRDGQRVAVKIQYPGIRQSLANDFRMFRALTKGMQASGHIHKSTIDEVERQIIAETDYLREADNIEFFGRQLAPLSFVKVPTVFRAYSSDKVLTMSLMRGSHLDDFLAGRPSQKLRDQLGTNLFELFYYQLLKVEALHADPHWGNYLFKKDGTISLVDFGCTKFMSPASIAYLRSGFLYPGSTHSPEFRRLLEDYYEKTGHKLFPETRRALIRFADNFYRRVYPPRPDEARAFDFGDKKFLQIFLAESKNLFRTKGVFTELIFMVRAEMGMYQTLHRLRAHVQTSRMVRKYL